MFQKAISSILPKISRSINVAEIGDPRIGWVGILQTISRTQERARLFGFSIPGVILANAKHTKHADKRQLRQSPGVPSPQMQSFTGYLRIEYTGDCHDCEAEEQCINAELIMWFLTVKEELGPDRVSYGCGVNYYQLQHHRLNRQGEGTVEDSHANGREAFLCGPRCIGRDQAHRHDPGYIIET